MTVAEFVKYLKKQGIQFQSHGNKHDVYVNPKNGNVAQIPRHQSKPIATGTKNRILTDLGIK